MSLFTGTFLAHLQVRQIHGTGTRGDDVKGPIIQSALLVALMSLFPTSGGAQQPPVVSPAAATSPNTVGQTIRVRHSPQIRMVPGMVVPRVESVGEGPPDGAPERPDSTAAAKRETGDAVAVNGEDAFLRPVWQYGFWAMPPGGMTRFLITPPIPVDLEDTLAPDPVTENTG